MQATGLMGLWLLVAPLGSGLPQHRTAPIRKSPPPPALVQGLSAKAFGATGDGRTDDTMALQAAIDASQLQGRALQIPAGRYMVSAPLNVSCRTPPLCNPECYSHSCATHQPARIVGEGQLLTYVVAMGRIESVFNLAGAAWPVTGPGTKHSQPTFNYSSGHEISDLSIQCYNVSDPTQDDLGSRSGEGMRGAEAALYGIWAPGTTELTFLRLHISGAVIAGAKLFYCFAIRFEDVDLDVNAIGIHSACTDLRVTGSNVYSQDIAGLVIDGGEATEIDNNVIEGTNGPAVIVSGGIWGAPFGVAVTNNIFLENNLRPGWWLAAGEPVLICTELLLNGGQWNQSFVNRPYQSWGPEFPIGHLGNDYPPAAITYAGNTGGAPGKSANDKTACTDYAAVTAVAATGVQISASHNTQALPRPSNTGALLRLGTDARVYAASDIVFQSNTPVGKFPASGQFYGWYPLVELAGADASIGHDGGELPLFSLHSPEIPQRNFYSPGVGSPANWSTEGFPAGWEALEQSPVVPGHNSRATAYVHSAAHSPAPAGAVIASFELEDNPDLAGSPVYFAFEAKLTAGASLSLMIDPGDGRWQASNSTKGLVCPRPLGFGCGTTQNESGFSMRSYQAVLNETGLARFALGLIAPSADARLAQSKSGGAAATSMALREDKPEFSVHATLAGIAIARIGASWNSIQ